MKLTYEVREVHQAGLNLHGWRYVLIRDDKGQLSVFSDLPYVLYESEEAARAGGDAALRTLDAAIVGDLAKFRPPDPMK